MEETKSLLAQEVAPSHASTGARKEGYLWKTDPALSKWQKRYFVLVCAPPFADLGRTPAPAPVPGRTAVASLP